MKRLLKRTAVFSALAALVWLSVLTWQILNPAAASANAGADVAVVLGAAVDGDMPSPVFEERIKHGISLYRSNRVEKILFTGGYAPGAKTAEASVARRYAIRRGVPPQAILTEALSRTTRENLIHARRVMAANHLGSALIVSDPLHLKRALRMASDLKIDAYASPTPTSRYRSWRSRVPFLLRELYFYNHYLLTGQ
jgi:uncharacterized SAM-binding protein YcdF (DUF218 family)